MRSGAEPVGPPGAQRVGEALSWLCSFYARHCNDDWEHRYGVRIETVDNPGWLVEIDLAGTALADAAFDEVRFDEGEDGDWYTVHGQERKLAAAGSPDRLGTLLCLVADALRGAEAARKS